MINRNMNSFTDTQLKQALAKMLLTEIMSYGQTGELLMWAHGHQDEVLDTELLHICWLIEQTLDKVGDLDEPPELRESQLSQYLWLLCAGCKTEAEVTMSSWQQRTIALAKVKGVEIV